MRSGFVALAPALFRDGEAPLATSLRQEAPDLWLRLARVEYLSID